MFLDSMRVNPFLNVDASSYIYGRANKEMYEKALEAIEKTKKEMEFNKFKESIRGVYKNPKKKTTIVRFSDGKYETVKLSDSDANDLGTAVIYAYMKHYVFPSMTQFSKFMKNIEETVNENEANIAKKKARKAEKNKEKEN